ncbi:hypothetical protein IFR04_012773 [Cadophora malorum]|uniref:Uncharacterized protein n=1 Tax=Cadophora malorum TaxID=108018 RepID=A0A8H7W3R3_9HELO|nr:hypothetical protein IFR04_012773 [Cadophora malorum]
MYQTRVIQITGPADRMTAQSIEDFFHTKIKFTLVDRQEWLETDGQLTVVFEFTSIEAGEQALYNIRYVPDYCAAGDETPGSNL